VAITAWSSSIKRALEAPSGARFFRCALQVNPHDYLIRNNKPTKFESEDGYNEAIVAACLADQVEAIAVTDHYRVKSSRSLVSAAGRAGIHVFPGFEAVTKDGIHVLCLFQPGTAQDILERYIGNCGIHDDTKASPQGNFDAQELLAEVKKWGGIAIAAHVDAKGGLLHQLRGGTTATTWVSDELIACAMAIPLDQMPANVKQILDNKDPSYQRQRRMAVIHAEDVVSPEQIAGPCASSWIKMSTVSIEGLRQAFLDPESRIRLSKDAIPEEHTELAAIAWEGGFLDGASVHFNENLNVLIGGRGAGKSTIVESIRYALGLDPLGVDSAKSHEGIIRQVLRAGTKVSLAVRSYRPAPSAFLIERTVPNPPIVRDNDGSVMNLRPLDILPQVEVFGQHEISEVSKSQEMLTRLLHRFVTRDPSLASRKLELSSELEKSRRRIVDTSKELAAVRERLATLPGLEETLIRYRAAGLEERLREQSLIVREERLLRASQERTAPVREILERLRSDFPLDTALVAPSALADLPGRDILDDAHAALNKLNDAMSRLSSDVQSALAAFDRDLAEVQKRWNARRDEVQSEYEAILRDLQRSSIDGEEFIRLQRQIEELRPLKEREGVLSRALAEHQDKRRNLLAEWEDVKARTFRELEKAAQNVSRQLQGRVLVKVQHAGNREPLFALLRSQIGGRLDVAERMLRMRDGLSLSELADAIRSGGAEVERKFSIPRAQADRVASASPEVTMSIEELDLEPTTEIQLNVASDPQPPQWVTLADLSTGQKATAVLLLLLLDSSAPLVVDQPEDDLDNRFITDGVVPKMRQGKRQRQFIFSTHNANIPVLGDAELIIGLVARGEAGTGHAEIPADLLGSIDSAGAREFAEEILEGGRDAFELRRLKYGF